jgi:hypothetical protein
MRGNTPKKWTDEEDAILRYGVDMGQKLRLICSRLPGRTMEALRGRKKVLGIVCKTGPQYRRAEVPMPKDPMPKKRFVQYDERNADWAKRTCLYCGVMFDSWGVGNRLCHNHRTMSMGID